MVLPWLVGAQRGDCHDRAMRMLCTRCGVAVMSFSELNRWRGVIDEEEASFLHSHIPSIHPSDRPTDRPTFSCTTEIARYSRDCGLFSVRTTFRLGTPAHTTSLTVMVQHVRNFPEKLASVFPQWHCHRQMSRGSKSILPPSEPPDAGHARVLAVL